MCEVSLGEFHSLIYFQWLTSRRSVFNDFGSKFTCVDPTGESPLTGMIASIDRDADGIVTGLEESRHGLVDGDYVTFSEVKGMTELNGCEPRKVTVKGECSRTVLDSR